MSSDQYHDGVLRQSDDDVNFLHHFYDAAGVELPSPQSPIPYTADEKAAAQATAALILEATTRDDLLKQLYAGVAQIESVRDSATSDQATADNLYTQAMSLKSAATTQKGQVQAFVPKTTYTQSDLTAIRDAIATVIARQETIIQAFADMYVYRKANDQSTVVTDNALLWLARLTSDRILN